MTDPVGPPEPCLQPTGQATRGLRQAPHGLGPSPDRAGHLEPIARAQPAPRIPALRCLSTLLTFPSPCRRLPPCSLQGSDDQQHSFPLPTSSGSVWSARGLCCEVPFSSRGSLLDRATPRQTDADELALRSIQHLANSPPPSTIFPRAPFHTTAPIPSLDALSLPLA